VVNEAFARRYWPGERAVGKTIRSRNAEGPVFEIVGIAADHKVLTVTEQPTPLLHVARIQRPNSYSAIVARTHGSATTLLRDMRRELLALEPNVVFVENQTMAAEAEATLFPARASAWLVGGVGLVAMLLAAIGLTAIASRSRGIARNRHSHGARRAAAVGRPSRDGAGPGRRRGRPDRRMSARRGRRAGDCRRALRRHSLGPWSWIAAAWWSC
jgi:hypothetical protein